MSLVSAFEDGGCLSWLASFCVGDGAVKRRGGSVEPKCAAFHQRLCDLEAAGYMTKLQPADQPTDYFTRLEMLGEGAFGKVYSVVPTAKALIEVPHLKPDIKTYAGKELGMPTKDLDLEMIQESYLELTISRHIDFLRSLRSEAAEAKHLIRKYAELWKPSASVYIVMEQLHGPNLVDWVHEQDYTVSERMTRVLIWQALSAVHYLHRYAGALHRDVKFENFGFLQECHGQAGSPVLKLFDLGLCWVLPKPVTEDTASHLVKVPICGTPIFMAPEVWRQTSGAASDIWGVGVMAHALLSGLLPFNLDSLAECDNYTKVRSAVRTGLLDLNSPEWKGTSAEAKAFVRKLLLRTSQHRHTTTEAFKDPWFSVVEEPSESRRVSTLSKLTLKSRKISNHTSSVALMGLQDDDEDMTMVPNSSDENLSTWTGSFETGVMSLQGETDSFERAPRHLPPMEARTSCE
eukprot:TRINITY_DN79063_c0_g1_i1.p1 TRINITY_DN79063_c0_g1~~TRINITY_DN79063_c0_g1_i1.p1  ORF type:complete len:461 (+),score=91.65 TRINITY_DN79063_c0_g1_i1:38-1420(+)